MTHDAQEMREMLRAMQSGELTVSRGIELLEMWLAGNYTDEQLPPVRNELGMDEMPWDRIDALTKEVVTLKNKIKESGRYKLREQLAAAQATNAKLRDRIAETTTEDMHGKVWRICCCTQAHEAHADHCILTTPNNTAALDARLTEEREKGAAHLDQVARDYKKASENLSALVAEYCADAIRSLT